MPEPIRFETLVGWRIIAEPAAIDAARWPSRATVVRISPDDVFLIGAHPPTLADSFAIVTPEHGFACVRLTAKQVAALAVEHIEWSLPRSRPSLAQGQIAGIPAKLVINGRGGALLLVACAARHEIEDRINR